jgi:hypothetical protein
LQAFRNNGSAFRVSINPAASANSFFSIYVRICHINDSLRLGGVVSALFGIEFFSLVEMENAEPPSVELLPMGLS